MGVTGLYAKLSQLPAYQHKQTKHTLTDLYLSLVTLTMNALIRPASIYIASCGIGDRLQS